MPTAALKIESESADFRTYEPETVMGNEGHQVTIQLCESLEDGRWEPFYSYVAR
jgi:hypothetical protein